MMVARDDGGFVFPIPGSYDTAYEHNGMTLRDWFAGQPDIVGSTLTISKEQGEALAGPRPDDPLDAYRWQCVVMASLRYIAADAMLTARKGGAA